MLGAKLSQFGVQGHVFTVVTGLIITDTLEERGPVNPQPTKAGKCGYNRIATPKARKSPSDFPVCYPCHTMLTECKRVVVGMP